MCNYGMASLAQVCKMGTSSPEEKVAPPYSTCHASENPFAVFRYSHSPLPWHRRSDRVLLSLYRILQPPETLALTKLYHSPPPSAMWGPMVLVGLGGPMPIGTGANRPGGHTDGRAGGRTHLRKTGHHLKSPVRHIVFGRRSITKCVRSLVRQIIHDLAFDSRTEVAGSDVCAQ
jgi:hypothetical protein